MSANRKTIAYLYGLERFGIKKGLGRTRRLLAAIGNPQNNLSAIHVAGTNGKGSVAAMLSSVLTDAGFKTGLYTSPHLLRFNERIRINGKPITDNALANIVRGIRRTPEADAATFFEFTTCLAFRYFLDKGVDAAVIETGMGGRWDATNLITPLVSVITNVAIDHAQMLGNSIEKIAFEKSGIIKKGVPVVTAEGKNKALSVIRKEAARKGSRLFVLDADFAASRAKGRRLAINYSGIHEDLKNVELSLTGAHQVRNAACVLAVIELLKDSGLAVSRPAIRKGLKGTSWPGRLEVVGKSPLVLLDAAHNPAGAKALASALAGLTFKRLILVLGIMADKDIAGILEALAPMAAMLIATSPETDRAASAESLKIKALKYGKPVIIASDVKNACCMAIETASSDDAVCVTGSIFTVAEAKRYFSKV